jgi:hypothetical protein
MSMHDELTSVQRCLDDLLRSMGRLEQQIGSGGLEMRRAKADAAHLRESLALLRDVAPGIERPKRPDLVPISDTPYDSALWTDTDGEGLGAHHGPGH